VDANRRCTRARDHARASDRPLKTLEEFDFKFQPSLDEKLVRELATGRFVAGAENVLVFGPSGVGKTHLAIALGRAVVEVGQSALFVSVTGLASLARAESDGTFDAKLAFFAKPKLLVIDELGYLPFEKRAAHLFFQLVARRYERGSLLPGRQPVGHRLRRPRARGGHPRPPPAPLAHPHDPRRELQVEAKEKGRPAR
jgi:DNA replication protein DnaC